MTTRTTLNPADCGANILLLNGHLQAEKIAADNAFTLVRSTTARNTGKVYFEFTSWVPTGVPQNSFNYVGLSDSVAPVNGLIGAPGSVGCCWGYGPFGGAMYTGAPPDSSGFSGAALPSTAIANGTHGIAVDFDTGKVWFTDDSGAWLQGDPVAGTSPSMQQTSGIGSTPLYAAAMFFSNDGFFIFNFGAQPLAYLPPNGFQSWDPPPPGPHQVIPGSSPLNFYAGISAPGVRLSLQSDSAIPTVDVPSASIIYVWPCNGSILPVYNGDHFASFDMSVGASIRLDATNYPAGCLFDVWGFASGDGASGSVGTSGSYTPIVGNVGVCSLLGGIEVNANQTTMRNGTGTMVVPEMQATYLGTFYTTTAGHTAMVRFPAAVLGGANNVLGLWNNYNRVRIVAQCRDLGVLLTMPVTNLGWTNASATWAYADASANNSITWVDGLGKSRVRGVYRSSFATQSVSPSAFGVGIALDADLTFANGSAIGGKNGAADASFMATAMANRADGPQRGLHKYTAAEIGTTEPVWVIGDPFSGLEIELDM
jgi:hypothetical protein